MLVSYAQNFEDVRLWRAFSDVGSGLYVDVGAQEPVIDSVSRSFYEHGWRGVHIEPTALYAERLRCDRPDELVLQVALGREKGLEQFWEIEGTGLSTTRREIAEEHQARGFSAKRIVVPIATLDDVFESLESDCVHWLKIDVEGGERAVLEGWIVSNVRPWVLVIESTRPMTQEEDYLGWEPLVVEKGYLFVCFDGLNRFYVHRDHEELAPRLSLAPNVFDGFVLSGLASNSFSSDMKARLDHAAKEAAQERARAQDACSDIVRLNGEIAEAASQVKSLMGCLEEADRRRQLAESRVEASDSRVLAAEARIDSAEVRAQAAESRALLAEARARESEQSAVDFRLRLGESDSRITEYRVACELAETRMREAFLRADAAVLRADEANARACEAETRALRAEASEKHFQALFRFAEERAVEAGEARQCAECLLEEATLGRQVAEGRAQEAESRAEESERRAADAERRVEEGVLRALDADAEHERLAALNACLRDQVEDLRASAAQDRDEAYRKCEAAELQASSLAGRLEAALEASLNDAALIQSMVGEQKLAEETILRLKRELSSALSACHDHWALAEVRKQHIDALLSSRSWRITAPVRTMGKVVKATTKLVEIRRDPIGHTMRYVATRPGLKRLAEQALRPFPAVGEKLKLRRAAQIQADLRGRPNVGSTTPSSSPVGVSPATEPLVGTSAASYERALKWTADQLGVARRLSPHAVEVLRDLISAKERREKGSN